jgi:mono/diheme cytochrome c family protein
VKRLLALVLLCACGGGRPRGPMSDGQRMYLSKCTSCHSAYEPAERTPLKWADAIDEMEAKKKVHLAPDERALILTYLTGNPGHAADRTDLRTNPAAPKR